jgi:phosphohistidine phosphatase
MKTLYLIRHAKSDWAIDGQEDFDRGLNSRGQTDLPKMKEQMLKRNWIPELILASSSHRTQLTSQGLFDEEIEYLDELYLAPSNKILEVLVNAFQNYDSIALVAHNPGVTNFLTHYCNVRIDNVPTLGISEIVMNEDDFTQNELKTFIYPKMI